MTRWAIDTKQGFKASYTNKLTSQKGVLTIILILLSKKMDCLPKKFNPSLSMDPPRMHWASLAKSSSTTQRQLNQIHAWDLVTAQKTYMTFLKATLVGTSLFLKSRK